MVTVPEVKAEDGVPLDEEGIVREDGSGDIVEGLPLHRGAGLVRRVPAHCWHQ